MVCGQRGWFGYLMDSLMTLTTAHGILYLRTSSWKLPVIYLVWLVSLKDS